MEEHLQVTYEGQLLLTQELSLVSLIFSLQVCFSATTNTFYLPVSIFRVFNVCPGAAATLLLRPLQLDPDVSDVRQPRCQRCINDALWLACLQAARLQLPRPAEASVRLIKVLPQNPESLLPHLT